MEKLAVVADWSGQCEPNAVLLRLLASDQELTHRRHVCTNKNIALGQQQQQPTVSADKRFFLVSDARIDNRAELLKLLKDVIESNKTITDSELILSCYLKWGQRCPEYLIGDFSFVVWDTTISTLFAACDGMNMRTLSYLSTEKELCLVSEGRQLLQHPKITPKLSEAGLAGWLCGWPDPTISMFDKVHRLPPGHSITANGFGFIIRKFWDINPEKQIRYRQVQEYQDHLRELLGRAIKDRLPESEAVVATQMSGGMDSTTITALAKQAADKNNIGLFVLSHAYPKSYHCDETQSIEETLAYLKISDSHLIQTERYFDLDFRVLYPPVPESPGTVLSPRYRDEMLLLKAAGAHTLLTGNGGDEMAWGHSLTYHQRLLRGDLKVLWEVIIGCRQMQLNPLHTLRQLFINPFIPTWIKRSLGRSADSPQFPDWIPKSAIQRLNLKERLMSTSTTRFHNPALQARYDALKRTATINSVRSYAHIGAEFNIDVRHPFFDTRIAEFSFAIPDDLWIRAGYSKWLVRKTMNGVLPDSVCWNRHKVIFDSFFHQIIRKQAGNIRHILSNTQLQDMGLLDNRKLLAAFDAVINEKASSLKVDLLYTLMTQVWFQRYWGNI
jgi:asparagine synthetase B (glutamine-hydrolysing)